MVCSACGGDDHRRNSKKCPMYDENKRNSTKNAKKTENAESKKSVQQKDSNARRELKTILLNDSNRKYLAMSAEKLQKLKPSFGVYQKSKFKGYVMTLKNKVMKENKNWPEPWNIQLEGHAKSFFLNDFETHYTMDPKFFGNYPLCFINLLVGYLN